MGAKPRLDVVLVDRGLASSRERARALILAGQVTVNGQVVSKAGAPVSGDARVELKTPDHPYVGRGGIKLAHALDRFGLLGIFFGVALIDSFPGTFNEPFLVMGYTSGAGFWRVWFVSSLGSFASAFLGYGIGYLVAHRPGIQALFTKFRVASFMEKYGPVALIVAAVTPLPFALFTWSAGATGLQLRWIFLSGLFRFVKIGFYMALIAAGWAAAT